MQDKPQSELSFGANMRILRQLLSAELAAGIFGLKLFIACVSIATFMMGAVWMMGDSLSGSLSDSGTTLLGGDAAVTVVNVPLDAQIVDGLTKIGAVSRVAELRSSAVVDGTRIAVELKGVDSAYPLNGAVRLASGQKIDDVLQIRDGRPSVIAESGLLRRLNIDTGDIIQLSDKEFVISDALLIEPDRLSAGRFMVGPRIIMRLDDLTGSGLIQRGAIIDYRYRVNFRPDISTADAMNQIAALRPETGWELETPRDAGDRVRRTVERTTTFLGMAGIVALAIGMAGAWASGKAWISRRIRTIALYRLSGATPGIVTGLHAAIIAIASSLGLILGLGFAAGVTAPVMQLISTQLHVIWSPANLIQPTLQVAWILILGIAGTSILSLAGVARLAPGAAMRSGEADLQPDNRQLGIGVALIALSMAGATLSLPVPALAGIAAGGLSVVALILAGGGWCLARLATSRRPNSFIGVVARQGLLNTNAVAMRAIAIGIGIAGITAILAAQNSLEQGLRAELPERIPDLVLIDVQPDQVTELKKYITSVPDLGGLQANPFMRMILTAVNGVPAEEALLREDKSWVIEGDRSFSWTAEPTGAELLAGEWWAPDYDGPPLLSPEEDLQEAFDLKPGDELTYSVLGRSFTSTVVNIRKEYHRTFRPEYLLMASPNPFQNAPQSWVMSLQGDTDAAVDAFINKLAISSPNITSIDIRTLVAQVTEVIDGAVFATLLIALTLLGAGALSLAAVIAAEVDARRREALAFTLIGASRSEIALARLFEAASIGTIAAVLGGAAGWAGGFWAVDQALRVAWAPGAVSAAMPLILGILAALAAAIIGALGALPKSRGQIVRQLSS